MDTLEIVMILCYALGILGLIALSMSFYLLRLIERLEKVGRKKDELLIEKDKEIRIQRKTVETLTERLKHKKVVLKENIELVHKLKGKVLDKNKEIIDLEKSVYRMVMNK